MRVVAARWEKWLKRARGASEEERTRGRRKREEELSRMAKWEAPIWGFQIFIFIFFEGGKIPSLSPIKACKIPSLPLLLGVKSPK